ncbi:MAG: hypothetical protein U5L10_04375 [Candidatus Moranbacteria bacterium]|nr:hypothetical protein [Candidatus Moranbacteria bacterium]
MFIDILNFIFVYFISGLILSLIIQKFAKKTLDKSLVFILGFGISPLLVSLVLYYLYSFFPGKEWFFYAIIIYTFYAILFILSYEEAKILHPKKIFPFAIKVFEKTVKLDIYKKILLGFVLFVVLFTFARNVFYPTTYTDAVEYLKQGFVYSQEHSHEKLLKKDTFSDFNENNPLYGPKDEFQMNKAIRPALPIFYSFFYKNDSPNSFNFFSINFIYSYYFLLCIIVVAYIIKKNKSKYVIIGLSLLLSCYFFTKLSYSNYKTMLTAFLASASLFLLYKITRNKSWPPAIFLGILCGLMSFVNYTGLVISGIIFLIGIFALKTDLKRKLLTILIIFITFAIFSGGEVTQYQNFIFKKSFLSFENRNETYDSKEFNSRLAGEGKKNATEKGDEKEKDATEKGGEKDGFKTYTLVTKKLQAFTQVQFFGFIFWLFLVILILSLIKKTRFNKFSKINLPFILLFFFVFFDPFFLNPHKFAYVLSLGYRYTAILSVFVAIFIAMNYEVFLDVLKKIRLTHLKFLLTLPLILFIPTIRDYMVECLMSLLDKITILTNSNSYYLDKLNSFLLLLAVSSLTLFIFIYFYQKYKKKEAFNMVNLLFIIIFFIIPSLFTINNNQSIINTFKYSLHKNEALKIQKASKNKGEKTAFEAIDYINQSIDSNSQIVLKDMPFSFNFWLYTKNNRRIVKDEDDFLHGNQTPRSFYLLSSKQGDLSEDNKISETSNCFLDEKLNYSTVWKCQKK